MPRSLPIKAMRSSTASPLRSTSTDGELWALEERSTGRFLGFTGLAAVPFDAAFTPAIAQIKALDFPPMTSEETRRFLGWKPTHPGLIADLEEGHYFTRA